MEPSWRWDVCFGVSLGTVSQVVRRLVYVPVALEWNNLYVMPNGAVDEGQLDSSTASLYEVGFWKPAGRSAAFSWNQDVHGGLTQPTLEALRNVLEHN